VLSPNQQYPEFIGYLKENGIISCAVSNLNLMAGTYSINLHYEIPGATKPYILEHVATFQILEKDVYGTGMIPSNIHGSVYFSAEWSF
jgi:hypothetical protein